jgi:tRNA-dihydrouridine synthase A
MMDYTDRHCRYFLRLLSPSALLYTEMITAAAIVRGDAARLLEFHPAEHPVALQLGGSNAEELARAARIGAEFGYDEINLNCGCPSDRVQKGAFGACLMAEPRLVADCVRAMQDAVDVPVTVKHRLGLDRDESYDFVRDFVGTIYETGCRVFIAHARNAVLKGLSPKENRQVPPLRHADVQRLKRDFPDAVIVLNGGLTDVADCRRWMQALDGIMLGRAAWHHPDVLAELDQGPDSVAGRTDEAVLDAFLAYVRRQHAAGVPLHILVRGILGWRAGRPGARHWRRLLSDPQSLKARGPDILLDAWAAALPA